MTKRLAVLFIVTTSLLMLSACDETQNEASIESSTSSSEIVEANTSKSTQPAENGYRTKYQASLAQFKNSQLDEAAGTIESVLENGLSDDSELKTQATELKTKINAAQAEKVKADETVALFENSAYKTERVSDLAATEFKEATGQNINSASDDKIKTWLTEKEVTENSTAAPSVTSSTTTPPTASSESTVSSSSVSSSTIPAISTEDERIMVLEKIIALTGISAQDNQFYSSKEDEKTYQVEVRHTHEVDGVEISNMVGIFKYDLLTENLMKMDPLTGEYEVYTE